MDIGLYKDCHRCAGSKGLRIRGHLSRLSRISARKTCIQYNKHSIGANHGGRGSCPPNLGPPGTGGRSGGHVPKPTSFLSQKAKTKTSQVNASLSFSAIYKIFKIRGRIGRSQKCNHGSRCDRQSYDGLG